MSNDWPDARLDRLEGTLERNRQECARQTEEIEQQISSVGTQLDGKLEALRATIRTTIIAFAAPVATTVVGAAVLRLFGVV